MSTRIHVYNFVTPNGNNSKVYDYVVLAANTIHDVDVIDKIETDGEKKFGVRNVQNTGSGCGFGERDQNFRVRKETLRQFIGYVNRRIGRKCKVNDERE